MALALSVKTGCSVKVGDKEVKVVEIHGKSVVVEVSGKRSLVTELERREVLPHVFLSTAKSKNSDGRTRLVFEAPKEIKIMRVEHAVQ